MDYFQSSKSKLKGHSFKKKKKKALTHTLHQTKQKFNSKSGYYLNVKIIIKFLEETQGIILGISSCTKTS